MRIYSLLLCSFGLLSLVPTHLAAREQWTEDQAKTWYRQQPWLVGSNYLPANAINQLEMWQKESFDPKRIDLEFGWAEKLGMNTMRVFLHDLVWQQDPDGFANRIDTFLGIAQKHRIKPMFVLFDSCWDPNPALGKQRAPRPGIHNSGWVQGPGASALQDRSQDARLKVYVQGVIAKFANDRRILGWDLWNEPDNMNNSSYRKNEPKNKVALVDGLLPQVFAWARAANPKQPITSGVWQDDWSSPAKLTPTAKIQLTMSDIVSFHNYESPDKFEARVKSLEQYHRPLLCTEYMARGNGSTFQGTLPVAKRYSVAAYNWGFVAGKSQTNLPWDSWAHPYTDREPSIWFHEIFKTDGSPYKQEETKFIRSIIAEKSAPARRAAE